MADVKHEVTEELGGKLIDTVVKNLFGVSWNQARSYVESGKIWVDGRPMTRGTTRVRLGAIVELRMNARKPRPDTDLAADVWVHRDAHVVVVNKPAGMSTIPYDDSEEGTLDARVRAHLSASEKGQPANLGVVHRIDKETSGLVVFTRTWLAKKHLSQQFREHTVHRRYFAIVHGHLHSQTFRTHLIENRGDGLRGSFEARPRKGNLEGQLAVTHVELVQKFVGASLIACRLETGRTHQIRIHLSEHGHPLVGERVYIRGFQGTPIPAPRMMLHAAELGFVHPATSEQVQFERPWPKDFEETLTRIRS